MFGPMFAPRPVDVARAMVRVTRSGGRILMGNWIPGDPTLVAQLLNISTSYSPPPPEAFVSPMAWGVPDVFAFQGTPSEFVDTFRQYYGPTMNAFEAAARDGREHALRNELVQLFESQDRSRDPETTLIPATFLKVTVEVG